MGTSPCCCSPLPLRATERTEGPASCRQCARFRRREQRLAAHGWRASEPGVGAVMNALLRQPRAKPCGLTCNRSSYLSFIIGHWSFFILGNWRLCRDPGGRRDSFLLCPPVPSPTSPFCLQVRRVSIRTRIAPRRREVSKAEEFFAQNQIFPVG